MSSKQLNFFITPEEHQKINEFFAKKGSVVLLNQDISDNDKIEIKHGIPENYVYKIYLSNLEFINKIKINTTNTDNGNIKSFDILESYLLEFNLGGFFPNDKNVLQRGRFYYVKSFWNDQNVLEEKSSDFIKWCDDFVKEFRKEFLQKYSKEKTFLYSKSAIKWIEENNASEDNGGQQWKQVID